MKLQFQFKMNFETDKRAREYFMRTLERARANPNAPDIPQAYLNTLAMHPSGTDEDVLLRTLIGEIVGIILLNELQDYLPPVEFGVNARVHTVQYQEVPPPREPSPDVTPHVLEISRQRG